MNISYRGIELIKYFEGCYLDAYLDSVKIPTIGYGTIIYPNGEKVKLGDTITKIQANEYLAFEVAQKERAVKKLTEGIQLNQEQYNALVSFVYNCGEGALKRSTLLKRIKTNPKDISIYSEFLKYNKAGGVVNRGLTRRRMSEAHLYQTGKLEFFEN